MSRAEVVRLVPNAERQRRAAVRNLSLALAEVARLAPDVLSESTSDNVRRELHPYAGAPEATGKPEDFFMLTIQAISAVWDWIRGLPREDRPQDVRLVLDKALTSMRWDTGEVMLSRDALAEKAGIPVDRVSRAMSVLAREGVIERSTVREPNKRGRGSVKYFINSHVGFRGSREAQAELRALTEPPGPLLRLMEGGKREHHAARDLAPTL